jgi:hypothetical protein
MDGDVMYTAGSKREHELLFPPLPDILPAEEIRALMRRWIQGEPAIRDRMCGWSIGDTREVTFLCPVRPLKVEEGGTAGFVAHLKASFAGAVNDELEAMGLPRSYDPAAQLRAHSAYLSRSRRVMMDTARQESMQEELADILEGFAGKIRTLKATEDVSLEKMLLNYWECCTVETVRSLVKHSVKPSNLISLLIGAAYEATFGDARERDEAILQMVLRCRIADPGSQH